MSVLQASDIRSGYGEMEVLHGVSVHVERREVVVVIGPNGAGKSTLMKTLFGLLAPAGGSVKLDAEDITRLRPDRIVRKGMCYVPQHDNVFPSLTVQENLEMGAFIRTGDLTPYLTAVFDRFPELGELRRQKAGVLSGGERQMLALGRALMLEPKMLLLDEPSSGLAPRLVGGFFERVREIAESEVGVMVVEQNVKEALAHSDRGYVMVMGENRYEDKSRALLEREDLASLYLGS